MSEDWTTSAATPVPTMRDRIISGTPEHGDSTRPTRRDTGVTPPLAVLGFVAIQSRASRR